jgi:leucyl/phenylalanyl-tRNA---protein transferase
VLHWIDDTSPLPPPRLALGDDSDAPGLLAAGGQVTPARLVEAYSQGIFPWYSEGQPVLWWSPNPRMVLPVQQFHLSHTLKKTLRRFLRTPGCTLRFDSQFEAVMQACASTARDGQDGTWIGPDMLQAYTQAHREGFVHSVETYVDGTLAGGLYFVNLGRMCFGESMFAWRTDASKIALAALVAACRERSVALIDCQQNTGHLARMGAHEVPREQFEAHLAQTVHAAPVADWTYDEQAWASLLDGPTTTELLADRSAAYPTA